MFKTITLCENFFESRTVYPNRVGVNWGSQHHWFCLGILYLIMIYTEGEGHKVKKTNGERNRRSSRAKPVARDTDTSDLFRM